jgi:hypothetical protein
VIASFRPLETLTHTAPLGVRFVDDVTDAFVSEGLTVLHPRAGSSVPARASATRGGVFPLRGLPGLGEVERGDGGEAFWASPPASGSFRIEVRDVLGLFHDFVFDAVAPTRGLFAELCGSPPRADASVPLFSTPSRPAPAAGAVVRAELRDADTGGPAAWALLEVAAAGARGRGIADARGAVAVFLPYPPLPTTVASPPAQLRPSLLEQTWPLSIEAFYGALDGLELCAALDQARAAISDGSPPAQTVSQTLRYGRELVLPGPLYLSRPA